MKYCAEAERCTADVVQKLRDWKVAEDEIEPILDLLKREKFLDDRRYLQSYISEKWNLDQWGKQKIRNKLEDKGFDERTIDAALSSIDQETYMGALFKLLDKKLVSIQHEPNEVKVRKLASFAGSKGFEEEYIQQWLEQNNLI